MALTSLLAFVKGSAYFVQDKSPCLSSSRVLKSHRWDVWSSVSFILLSREDRSRNSLIDYYLCVSYLNWFLILNRYSSLISLRFIPPFTFFLRGSDYPSNNYRDDLLSYRRVRKINL